MTKNENTIITVQTSVKASPETVWKHWTSPESIIHWNNASDDWHTPKASNDLRKNGRFSYRMEARDGSGGFDFEGTYDHLEYLRQLDYTMDDGRKVQIAFSSSDGKRTDIIESFEAESVHSIDQQRSGWQSILDNFRRFAESAE